MAPRIAPLTADELTDDTREILGLEPGRAPNEHFFATLARHPRLLRRWQSFGKVLLFTGTLPPRERELAILRTAWLWQAGYEWSKHVLLTRDAGVTDEQIERVRAGADGEGWSDGDRVVVAAAEEIYDDGRIADATWKSLAARFDEQQLIELVMVLGQYTHVAFLMRTLNVDLEDDCRHEAQAVGLDTPEPPPPLPRTTSG